MTQPPNMPEYGTPAYEQWYQQNYLAQYAALQPPPPQQQAPRKKHHPVRWTAGAIVAVIVIAAVATNSGGSNKKAGDAAAVKPSVVASQGAATKTTAAPTATRAASATKAAPTSYQRYESLAKAESLPALDESTVASLAQSLCALNRGELETVLSAGDDKATLDNTGIALRAYCPSVYPGFKAIKAQLLAPKPKPSPKPKLAPAPKPAPKPSVTTSEEQAIEAAQSYLGLGTGFSRAGLIDQLDSSAGNGFPEADAVFAVDHVTVDWDAQAVVSAKSYMQLNTGFSRSSLIDQLTSQYGSQFTLAQATYAADHVGL